MLDASRLDLVGMGGSLGRKNSKSSLCETVGAALTLALKWGAALLAGTMRLLWVREAEELWLPLELFCVEEQVVALSELEQRESSMSLSERREMSETEW